ncbi:putative O-methyltransferase YrrM [Thermocatellispora tengchongensis]|uniref:Putative O-methyltransferase YrrM n=1 Tax=Thermocatellispora tengchongensis TaxID=1073253 RepID=A0A840P106_9ACTN|nr:class I SAM-dependent methyltransferase [Thermocatellispora tengchongensis]MBB5130937.1 putative O-methyltransferase YrrM [Thermocatellispora tengchongensis]
MAGLVLLSVFGLMPWHDALQLAVSAAVLAALAMIVIAVRRADGKALRTDNRVKRQEATLNKVARDVATLSTGLTGRVESMLDRFAAAGRANADTVIAALGEDRAELAAHTTALREQAARLDGHDAKLAEIARSLARVEALLSEKVLPEVRSRGDFSQVEAMIDLRALLRPRAPLPRLRGWAASPDVLRLLIERIAADRPKLIVECGSGASSIWLGYAVERYGEGRVIALEHDERFVRATADLVAAHGLEDVVEVRHAPLADWRGFPWYDTAALDDLTDIGLVFVDGPPNATGPLARYPAVPLLLPRCAPSALIVLDDARRPEEREVAERWLREFPDLSTTTYPAEKGAMLFHRSPV